MDPTSDPLLPLVGLAAAFGAIIGSFLNVVIHRVPRGESVVRPGSRCPHCLAPIRASDNIPLLGFLLRRGRCRDCHQRISPRYPLVELLTALIFGLIILRNGAAPDSLAEMLFASCLIALIFIDAATRTLPNVITYPLLLTGLLATLWRWGWGDPIGYAFDLTLLFTSGSEELSQTRLAIKGGLLIALAGPLLWLLDRLDLFLFGKYFEPAGEPPDDLQGEEYVSQAGRLIGWVIAIGLLAGAGWTLFVLLSGSGQALAIRSADQGLVTAATGALVGVLPLWLLRTLYFQLRGLEGMGLGDVKMMAGVGAFLGWQGALSVLLLGSITGAIFGLVWSRLNGNGLRTEIPFGCFLGFAALATLFRSAL
ncbi:MAG: prepilin peptidase [Acidobacteria bacterium]|nr:prepilin peptidase [Acidobacteriota bacterium]